MDRLHTSLLVWCAIIVLRVGTVKTPTGLTSYKQVSNMSNKDINTPEQEVNDAPEETVNDTQDTGEEIAEKSTEETQEETVGSYQEETQKDKKVPDEVPMARLNKEINRRKELEKELGELKQEKDKDDSVSDTDKDPDVKELADKLAKIEEKEQQAKVEAALDNGLEKAMENNPEFKDIANPAIIKQMALNPANKDKTFTQLLEEAYGNAISGKRTTETTTPRGGTADTKVDMDRVRTDTEYRRQVLADPNLSKQYNENRKHYI